jgi:hypothetical protein
MNPPWTAMVRMIDVPMQGSHHVLEAGEPERARVARDLHLIECSRLDADLHLKPWFDGAELSGRWTARIAQACGVTLERLDQDLSGEFLVHIVPQSSLHAPGPDHLADLDPDALDPPDVSEDGCIDLAGYVVEHLALEIDPFPRKPGAEFLPPSPDPEFSPFAVLKRLHKED